MSDEGCLIASAILIVPLILCGLGNINSGGAVFLLLAGGIFIASIIVSMMLDKNPYLFGGKRTGPGGESGNDYSGDNGDGSPGSSWD